MSEECVISSVLSCYSKDLKQQTSVTAQFYLASKGKYIFKVWRWADPKESQGSILGPLFKCFFSSPGPALCKLGQPGVLFIYLRSSLRSLYLPLFYFHRLFPFFVFKSPLFWTPFSYSNYLTFLPKETGGPILWEYGRQVLFGYFLAELGWRGALGLPVWLVSRLRVPTVGSN